MLAYIVLLPCSGLVGHSCKFIRLKYVTDPILTNIVEISVGIVRESQAKF